MKYAYRQLLGENPGRFRDVKDKEHLARSVLNSLEFIRSGPAKNANEVVALIMAEGD